MVQTKEFHVCIECDPPHVDNCSQCFGWGFHVSDDPDRRRMISASEVKPDMDFEMCFECFGTPINEDIFIFWGDPRLPKPVGIINART